eukprot:256783_1
MRNGNATDDGLSVNATASETIELFINLYDCYVEHGVKELEELMGYWVNDNRTILAIELRLFKMFSNNKFDTPHRKLHHHFNEITSMQYKWKHYNIFLFVLFECEEMYTNIFVIEYLSSMGCRSG